MDYRDHPIVQRIYPAEVIDATRQLCKERPLFLEGRHRQPQTLCHHDVFRRNLFAQDDYTLAIDWEMMGIGAAGEDLAGLVSAYLALEEVDPAQCDAYDKVVFSGDMDGLRDIGWQVDADLVWFGLVWFGLVIRLPLHCGTGYVWLNRLCLSQQLRGCRRSGRNSWDVPWMSFLRGR